MPISIIGFAAFLFVGMTAWNRILEGAMISSGDIAILDQITIFDNYSLFGAFNVPILNLSFLTEGIPHMLKFDYSYFGGNAGLISYFLYSLSAAIAFGLFVLVVGSIISRTLGRV